MSNLRNRWYIVLPVVVVLGLAGVLVYANTSTHTTTRPVAGGEVDNPNLGVLDADAAGEHDATVDLTSTGTGPVASTVAGHTVFIDTRTLKSKPVKKAPRAEVQLRDNAVHSGPAVGVQTDVTALAAPSPIINALGLDFATWGAGHPPDTNGVIGPNHFVQGVNTSVGIFNKSTGALISAFTYDAFFANSGTAECDANNGGDITIVYDVPSGKWVIADLAWIDFNAGPYYECIAVSSGSDPVASTWTFYSVPAGDGRFPDYPKFGSGPDGVYFTTNNFQLPNTYTGAGVYAIKRTSLGSPSLQIQHVTTSSSFFSLLAANLVDSAPPAGPEYVTSIWSGRLRVWRFSVDWTTPANTTFTSIANKHVSYSSQGSIPTPGETVDSLSPRAMNKAQLRNGSLWLTHTVHTGSVAGVRWYEVTNLTGSPTINQQSTFAPADGQNRWMPSLAVDKQGNMIVGYNVASGSLNPAIRYAGRLVTDPLNTLGQSETSLIAGTGAPSSGNFNRWGDYSEMSVDPVDGCTFWFTGEYYAVTGANWQTRIGSFKYPGCV
jgi:hypothetical protein